MTAYTYSYAKELQKGKLTDRLFCLFLKAFKFLLLFDEESLWNGHLTRWRKLCSLMFFLCFFSSLPWSHFPPSYSSRSKREVWAVWLCSIFKKVTPQVRLLGSDPIRMNNQFSPLSSRNSVDFYSSAADDHLTRRQQQTNSVSPAFEHLGYLCIRVPLTVI